LVESFGALLVDMTEATMQDKSGIQIIQSSPFHINVIDRLILKIKNI
jgi:hypothetical protein